MTKAIYAGSFNPLTIGHLSIIKKALGLFDKIIVVVAENESKGKQGYNSKKLEAITKVFEDEYLSDRVEVIYSSDLIADFAASNNVKYLVRGLRNTTDYQYEENYANYNKWRNPDLETIYVRADKELDFLSSTVVRDMHKRNEDVSKLVPPAILDYLNDKEA